MVAEAFRMFSSVWANSLPFRLSAAVPAEKNRAPAGDSKKAVVNALNDSVQRRYELQVEICSVDACRFYRLRQYGVVPIEKLGCSIFIVWMCFKECKKNKKKKSANGPEVQDHHGDGFTK